MATVKGEGTLLAYSPDGTTFTTIAQRLTITGPKMEVASIETTHLDSLFKTFRPSSCPDQGTIDMEFYFDPDIATHTTIRTLMNLPLATATTPLPRWRLTFTDAGTAASATFSGFPTSFEMNGMEMEGNLMANMSVKISGEITWA